MLYTQVGSERKTEEGERERGRERGREKEREGGRDDRMIMFYMSWERK